MVLDQIGQDIGFSDDGIAHAWGTGLYHSLVVGQGCVTVDPDGD